MHRAMREGDVFNGLDRGESFPIHPCLRLSRFHRNTLNLRWIEKSKSVVGGGRAFSATLPIPAWRLQLDER